jgi:hypothetical protein
VSYFDPDTNRWEETKISATKGVIGFGLAIRSRAVYPRLANEAGLHTMIDRKTTSKALLITGQEPMEKLPLPQGIERKGTVGQAAKRRLYRVSASVEDSVLGVRSFPGATLGEMIRKCCDERFRQSTRSILAD